jgi:hypothetical protein
LIIPVVVDACLLVEMEPERVGYGDDSASPCSTLPSSFQPNCHNDERSSPIPPSPRSSAWITVSRVAPLLPEPQIGGGTGNEQGAQPRGEFLVFPRPVRLPPGPGGSQVLGHQIFTGGEGLARVLAKRMDGNLPRDQLARPECNPPFAAFHRNAAESGNRLLTRRSIRSPSTG